MSDKIIADELIFQILQVLEQASPSPNRPITFEVQDDGQCIMFYIPVDDVPPSELQANIERIGRILNDMVPRRQGDYSWFATFTIQNNRVDSCFGGNLDFPNTVF
jgi:hypothetical protein